MFAYTPRDSTGNDRPVIFHLSAHVVMGWTGNDWPPDAMLSELDALEIISAEIAHRLDSIEPLNDVAAPLRDVNGNRIGEINWRATDGSPS